MVSIVDNIPHNRIVEDFKEFAYDPPPEKTYIRVPLRGAICVPAVEWVNLNYDIYCILIYLEEIGILIKYEHEVQSLTSWAQFPHW